jgi:heme exporter protein D
MCFESPQQLNWFVYGLGVATVPGIYAVWRFLKWSAISLLRHVVGSLHRKLNPEIDRRQDRQQQPKQQQQQNPNKGNNNGQGNQRQDRQQSWQQPQRDNQTQQSLQ